MNIVRMEAAKRYAEADKSDPFTFARIVTHMRNGIASVRQVAGELHDAGEDAFYSADDDQERRTYQRDGETVEYYVPAFRNRKRP